MRNSNNLKKLTSIMALAILAIALVCTLVGCGDDPSPHEHVWVDATCTSPKTCSECNATEGDALGHTWVDATCTLPKTCSVCQATEGDPAGHSYTAVVTAPTCTEAGYTTYTCACGDTYKGDEVAALGHTEVTDAAKAPTCTETGLTEGKHCSVCNEVILAQTTVDALGHTWVDASCTAPKTCSVCQATEGEAKGHSYTTVVTAPTCTTKGYTTYTCTCGDTYKGDEKDALGHTEQTLPAKDATCTETGLTEGKKCTECGTVTVAQTVVVALGHDMIVDKAVAAGCESTGLTEGSHCSRCDHKVAQTVVPALGHADADKNHKCDICEAILGECSDADKNHKCDVCEAILSECADADKNHKCDLCGATLSECADADKNHK